ncbi:MAG TPA: HK97 family phage prohead protease [Burkholderiales bacterium]|nr:HK97 family phage prohead protease [Burkholderiales bacterium]
MPRENRASAPDLERRTFTADAMRVETRAEGGARLMGHAAVFNQTVKIGRWFRERIAPGAFRRAIAEDDVRALFNHDEDWVLGRNRAGTLRLSEDAVGLAIDISPPDTQLVRDLVLAPVARGDVSQMSFGFKMMREEWDESEEIPLRTLLEVELFDVSPVTFPAFPTTDVALRTLETRRTQTQNAADCRAAAIIAARQRRLRLALLEAEAR